MITLKTIGAFSAVRAFVFEGSKHKEPVSFREIIDRAIGEVFSSLSVTSINDSLGFLRVFNTPMMQLRQDFLRVIGVLLAFPCVGGFLSPFVGAMVTCLSGWGLFPRKFGFPDLLRIGQDILLAFRAAAHFTHFAIPVAAAGILVEVRQGLGNKTGGTGAGV